MGFGPKAPDVESGVQAVRDLIELLYPDRATDRVLELMGETARALLTAKAALTFENIGRFWQNPAWRRDIMSRWATPLSGPWDVVGHRPADPRDLDPDFGWLINDRIQSRLDLPADDRSEDVDS